MDTCEILGHDKTFNIINSFIQKAEFTGGYIFSGPEGIGKRRAAEFTARKLDCSQQDLHIIEGEDSHIKIDDIRNVLRLAGLRPYNGNVKIFIIDNAHKLNIEAANSLLKTLEEPPRNTLFFLITHKPQNIIKTVLSRCKTIKFSPMPRQELENILVKKYLMLKEAAHFIAYYSEGRIGLALKLKDSFDMFKKNKILDSFVLSNKPLDQGVMAQSKEEIRSCLNILASWFRDIYLLKAGAEESEIINQDRSKELKRVEGQYSFRQLDEAIAVISESVSFLEKNINSKLLLHNLGVQLWKA